MVTNMQTPKFILSKSKALEQYHKVKKMADLVSYSSKTNQDITKILENSKESNDCMFSVHFVNELKHISDKSRVIFIAQAWNNEMIKQLIEMKIRNFVVDNETDLDELLKFLSKNEIKINLLLRIKLKENTVRTEKYFVFGMDHEAINRRIPELRKNKNIAKLGIHFHKKTQNMSEWDLKYELENMILPDNWKNIDLVNIGGGLPAAYANTNEDVLAGIFVKLVELRKWLNSKKIKMIIEPGRFIAAPAVKLVTKIVCIDSNNITVNASVYNTDMDALIVPVKLLVEGEVSKENGKAYVVKGITPCSMDLFRYRVYLKDPKVGDTLTFLNAGAYNFYSDFCDLEKIETEIVE